jgi:lipopolysaccharide transport system ATP-binding protein
MAAVNSLCSKGIVLEKGMTSFIGGVEGAVEYYLKASNDNAQKIWPENKSPNTDFLRLLEVKVLNTNNIVSLNHLISNDIKIEFTYEIIKEGELFTHGFNLYNNHNIHILSSHDKDSDTLMKPLINGVYKRSIIIPNNLLAEGGYTCSFAIMRYNPFKVELHETEIVGFNVIDELDSIDKVAELNVGLLSTYQSQKSYITKIYPVCIFFLVIGLIYLSYITYKKFIDNVWSQYKD